MYLYVVGFATIHLKLKHINVFVEVHHLESYGAFQSITSCEESEGVASAAASLLEGAYLEAFSALKHAKRRL